VRDLPCGDTRICLEVEIRRVECKNCGNVKQERLDWLADNPFYTKRFAFFVGQRCRTTTIKDVAQETRLDWKTIKELDKQYMQEQLRRRGRPEMGRILHVAREHTRSPNRLETPHRPKPGEPGQACLAIATTPIRRSPLTQRQLDESDLSFPWLVSGASLGRPNGYCP
jgi:hypothetical protein